MELTVSHRITTRFTPARRRLLQSHRLFPTICASQQIVDWRVTASDGKVGADFVDGAGDRTQSISTGGEVSEQTIEIAGILRTVDTLGVLRDCKEKVPPVTYLSETRYTRPDAAITAMAQKAVSKIAENKILDRAHALSNAVSEAVEADKDGEAAAAEALDQGLASIEGAAHLLIAAAHALDLPARFVYGYLAGNTEQLQSAVDAEDATGGLVMSAWPGHAWTEIRVDGLGWVGFDPLNECCPDETYIRICSGRDSADGLPLRATALGQGGEALEVALDVRTAAQ